MKNRLTLALTMLGSMSALIERAASPAITVATYCLKSRSEACNELDMKCILQLSSIYRQEYLQRSDAGGADLDHAVAVREREADGGHELVGRVSVRLGPRAGSSRRVVWGSTIDIL